MKQGPYQVTEGLPPISREGQRRKGNPNRAPANRRIIYFYANRHLHLVGLLGYPDSVEMLAARKTAVPLRASVLPILEVIILISIIIGVTVFAPA